MLFFLLNRLPSKVLHNKSPYDILYGFFPNLAFIKVFGCEAFASTLAHNRTKLDPRTKRCVYIGHRPRIRGSLFMIYTPERLFYPKMFLSMKIVFLLSTLSIIQILKFFCHATFS